MQCINKLYLLLTDLGAQSPPSVHNPTPHNHAPVALGVLEEEGPLSTGGIQGHTLATIRHLAEDNSHEDVMAWQHFPYYWPFARTSNNPWCLFNVLLAWTCSRLCLYSDVMMSEMAYQITDTSIVCLTVCTDAYQRKHQSAARHWPFYVLCG